MQTTQPPALETPAIRILPNPAFVHLQVTTTELDMANYPLVIEHLANQRAEGINRLLFEDCVEQWNLTTGGILTVVESLRHLNIFDMRIAVLSTKAKRLNDLRFVETAAINRGYDLKVFSDKAVAMGWLLAES
jgi:hypothetical protein